MYLQLCIFAMLILSPVQGGTSSQTTNNKHTETECKQASSMKELTLKLFHNRSYLLLLWSSVIYSSGLNALYTFIMALFESEGLSFNMSNMVLSVMGFATLVGNLGLSGLSQLPGLNSIVLHAVSAVISGELLSVLHL